jgi:hypothetical protein
VRLLSSYGEAARLGYFSVTRLRETGLEVREFERSNYLYMVETAHGNLPVFSREQASEPNAPDPVSREETQSSDPTGVKEILLLPEGESTATTRAALCGQNCPVPGLSSRSEPTGQKRRTRGQAKPRSTGYFVDTPENLEVPIEITEQELKALGITLAPGKLMGKPM